MDQPIKLTDEECDEIIDIMARQGELADWYVQVLSRYNEAIALDYIIPFRILAPIVGQT